MNQGKLMLQEVGSKRWEISFSESDPWVLAALKASAPHEDITGQSAESWAANSQISGDMVVERMDPEYNLSGSFEARVPVLCPRCGAEGSAARSGSMHVFIRPLARNEEADEGDDPDYIFLETPYIDLTSILSEQVVATEPVVEYPDQELDGKPHSCSLDLDVKTLDLNSEFNSELNERAAGQSEGKARNSPFDVLAKLKSLKKE